MKKMLCLSLPFLFLVTIFAADFWEKKEYKEWTQKECAKVLEDSPWARSLTLTSVQIMDNDSNKTSTDGSQPFIKYQMQFRSALPIRQAVVRQNQIASKYDTLPPEQKQSFDKQAEALLSGFPEDKVVVYVRYQANDSNRDREMASWWQSKSTELLKTQVYLSSNKTKVPIAQFVAGQGGDRWFQFIFPKEVDGKPVITPQDKSIKLEFEYPADFKNPDMKFGSGQAFQEFKVEKMIFAGNIAY
jgi:hypothetical protein